MVKTKNLIGRCYDEATRAQQMKFRAALMETGETDNVDYATRFRQTWQYVPSLGLIPTAITDAAKMYIGYIPEQADTTEKMLLTLKMKAA